MEFIYECHNFLPISLCSELIQLFENNKDYHIVGQTTLGLNENVKKSTDLVLSWLPGNSNLVKTVIKKCSEIVPNYSTHLENANLDRCEKLKKLFSDCYVGHPQIQKTKPGGFYRWHTDCLIKKCSRLLTFIIYLNDVKEGSGGTTDFVCGKNIKPEMGKLLVFPGTLTYVHRGKKVENGEKYILTSFVWCEIPKEGIA